MGGMAGHPACHRFWHGGNGPVSPLSRRSDVRRRSLGRHGARKPRLRAAAAGAVGDVLTRLSHWTELPFDLMPPGTPSEPGSGNTILVKLIPRPEFQRLYRTRDVVCQTETRGVGGTLQVGYMALSEGYTDCLKHEFMHALGFDSHWCPKNPSEIHSVLALRESPARSDDYSPWDILAIRVLYDWRIQAGMNRQKSLTIAYEVIQQHPQSASLPAAADGASAFR
jgi:hypothetical protein